MSPVYNFCAGPATLPKPVMERAREELCDYLGKGMSPMEISHRSSEFSAILQDAESRLRKLAAIPENYRVLFLQGGASLQFPMAPMNLQKRGKGAYVITGRWAMKAYEAAKLQNMGLAICGSADRDFSYIPKVEEDMVPDGCGFLHVCYNNTLYGTKFFEPPKVKKVPLVADMSSCLLSEPIRISDFGLIYAGAQKNLGPAGLCVVIIREDLIDKDLPDSVPMMLRYSTYAENGSLYNTPPTYQIYIMDLVMQWLEDLGGVEKIAETNYAKARLLYSAIRESSIYVSNVGPRDRSIMNVFFHLRNRNLEPKFLEEAEKRGLMNLKGHRVTGGIRASIYNAMPLEGVEALCEFMKEFEERV